MSFWKKAKPAEKEVRENSDEAKILINEIETNLKEIGVVHGIKETYYDESLNKYTPNVKSEVLRSIEPLYKDLDYIVRRFSKRVEKNVKEKRDFIKSIRKVIGKNIEKHLKKIRS